MRRASILFCIALLCVAPGALATGFPIRAKSTVPACISLVGSNGGVPAHAFGGFVVVIRDLANNPVAGATVTIDLSGCPELHLCADQLDPDATVDCAQKSVRKFTDALGTARFTILGGSNGAGHAITRLNGGRIYWDEVLIGSPTVSA